MEFLSPHEWGVLIAFLLALGALAGFLAGLLGIGGGVVLVPGLYYGLTKLGFDPDVMMHVALGTSLAVIIPTGISSARGHWKKGAVRVDLVKRIGIGILIGVIIGTIFAHFASAHALKGIFAGALIFLAIIMLSNPARYTIWDDVPKQPWAGLAGAFIGALASVMGVGGATMTVPYMSFCKVPMHTAVGTASALGLVIAVPAAVGFAVIGWKEPDLPPFSLGYISFLVWPLIVPASIMAVPFGVRLSHKLSVDRLRKVFAIFLALIALRMLWGALHG